MPLSAIESKILRVIGENTLTVPQIIQRLHPRYDVNVGGEILRDLAAQGYLSWFIDDQGELSYSLT